MTRRPTTPIRLSEAGSRKRIIISERIIHIIHIRFITAERSKSRKQISV